MRVMFVKMRECLCLDDQSWLPGKGHGMVKYNMDVWLIWTTSHSEVFPVMSGDCHSLMLFLAERTEYAAHVHCGRVGQVGFMVQSHYPFLRGWTLSHFTDMDWPAPSMPQFRTSQGRERAVTLR